MATLTTHHTNDLNRELRITPVFGDTIPSGGAPAGYQIDWPTADRSSYVWRVTFHTGEVSKVGITGLTHEVLTAIMIDRLEHFQRGPFACVENEIILSHFKSALAEMAKRSQARVERGVEGTHQV